MQVPIELSFRGMEHSDDVDELVRENVANLERFYDRIVACRVMVESPHRHKNHGQQYHVRIDLTVPGHEIVVSRDPSKNDKHERVDVAVRDAFKTARRLLKQWLEKVRGDTKTHAPSPVGQVIRLFPEEGYGFIGTEDGREVYFHENSVLDEAFAQLEVGSAVTFAEEMGDKGPQASTVRVHG